MAILEHRTQDIEKICAKYPKERRRSALLPMLWLVQEQEGWISQQAMREVAEVIGCTPAEVYEVVSFYTMYKQKPAGRHHIALCKTIACAVCGAHEVSDYIRAKAGIHHGSISDDGRFSIEEVECIGACSEAPAVLINETLYGNLTPARVDELLAAHT